MASISLIFPNQLFDSHPALSRDREVCLIEDSLFFGDPHALPGRFHSQKIVLHRASMKQYASTLEQRGHEVRYIDYRRDTTADSCLEKLRNQGFSEFHYCEPVDFLLEKRLTRFFDRSGCGSKVYSTPMFLSPAEWIEEHFEARGKKRPFMAPFYEAQRKRMNLLIDSDGEPVGGRWSFDDENRKPMPKSGLDCPALPPANGNSYVREASYYVSNHFQNCLGSCERFNYPISHDAAEKWLDNFLEKRFSKFGPYEDAIARKEPFLFHSVLTPSLNIGLLTPHQVIERALNYANENDIPLNSLEGFVRQIVGWREFIRAMYERHGVEMRNGNFWKHQREIPDAFYDGTTGIDPVDTVIDRLRETGYCHHIERLMVLGNFMLLCGFKPEAVYRWFMELFIDSYDWVMVPNVYDMSQFASGGIFSTKPYISGSNYIRKMSDYPKGDWCETWDALFWSFIKQHEKFFRSQHRLAMMAGNLDRMGEEKLNGHLDRAESFLSSF